MAAEFLYPTRGNFSAENDNRMINVFDDLFLEYSSSWASLNLTLFCLESTTSTTYQVYNVGDNPILGSGIYHFGSIQSHDIDINQYPIPCSFKLTEFETNDNGFGGQQFWVTSDASSSTTFSPTPTSSISASSGTGSNTQTTNTAAVPSNSSSSAVATATQSSAPITSSGLSTGAAAGIGIGVGLAVITLAAIILFMCFKRRKQATVAPDTYTENPSSPAPKSERYSQYQYQSTQEMEVTSSAGNEYGQSGPLHRHELS